ncbi:MFS transporter [Egicoccus halophilus]|uniref:MFS transporter n=2 Tax=Egicoccus halophilus TaxID=1670830 RepID=A0A8J3A788_9ACTN|nr:MFS transporter [Egicoccus halophilus]
MPPAALAVHLSIGQVYAFSVFKLPLVERFGTSETAIAVVFSIAIVMLGLSAAFGGTWMERNGPRRAMVVAAACWSSGFLVAALGIALGQLWLVHLGYGVIGGIGLGIGYISPVSTLLKWFPDRPGLATGLAIMGFGGGALVAAPVSNRLLALHGANGGDGLVATFVTLAAVYLVLIAFGAATIRVPAPGWTPPGRTPPVPAAAVTPAASATMPAAAAPAAAVDDRTAAEAMRTRQFWLLWLVLFCNVSAGIGILEQAAPMVQDFFAHVSPETAAGYVGVLALANMAGRFGWSSASDAIGRRRVYVVYLGVGALAFLAAASLGTSSLPVFVLATAVAISFYGGGFATVPAYLRDLFGSTQVGAIHGRLLTAWSAAGVAGPLVVNVLTDARRAAGVTGAAAYRPSLLLMVGLLLVGLVANLAVRPLPDRRPLPDPRPLEPAVPA